MNSKGNEQQPAAAPGIDRCSLLDIVAWWNSYTGPVDEALGEVIRRIRSLIDASPKGGSEAIRSAIAGLEGSVAVGSDGEWVSVRRYARDAAVKVLRDAEVQP